MKKSKYREKLKNTLYFPIVLKKVLYFSNFIYNHVINPMN